MPSALLGGAAVGVVAAGHEVTADAAASALRQGGNAFDAVLAAGFAAAVCEPGFTSLAGGGFLLAAPVHAEPTLVDFFVDTPGRGLPGGGGATFDEIRLSFAAAQQTFHAGPGSVAVPGVLAGYLHVHRRWGTLPLRDVVAPAVRAAADGVEVTPTQASDFDLLAPILGRTAGSRAVFLPNGRVLRVGERLLNPDQATFLERLGEDPAATFYQGALAERFVDQMASGGGLVTAEDLAAYQVHEREPLRIPYRGHTLLTNPPPSFGGALLGVALRRLQAHRPLPGAGSPRAAWLLAATMAGIDRDRAVGHPEVVAALAGTDARPWSARGTTHVSVVDADGNAASMTTSNGEGSGDVVDGTGIPCNNMLGEDDLHPEGFHTAHPGSRVASMMAPSVLLDAAGAPALVLGSGGSKRIRSALLQVLVAVVDHGADLHDAVASTRMHVDDGVVEVEPGLPAPTLRALGEVGRVNVWPSQSIYFGGVHALDVRGGRRTGVGDPRRGGAVRVVRRR